MNIYFDKESLLEYLANLEEDNLFTIHLVQEDDHSLEAMKKDIERNLKEREEEIEQVRKNIQILENQKAGLVAKQQFLEQNMKLKQQNAQGGAHHGSGYGGTSNAKHGESDVSRIMFDHQLSGHPHGPGLDEKSALIMLQQATGCSVELINHLADKV